MSKKILLFTTQLWPTAALLADGLNRAGLSVAALRPGAHPLRSLRSLTYQQNYQHLQRHALISKALAESGADYIFPCDDVAVSVLHQHHARLKDTGGPANELATLEASLGDPRHYDVLERKSAFVAEANKIGIGTPESSAIASADELTRLTARVSWPMVLKSDGWWGGRGTCIVHSQEEALRAYDELVGASSLFSALKDAGRASSLMPFFSRNSDARRTIVLQAFKPGCALNRAVLCDSGRVIAGHTFEAVQSFPGNGAATVVRLREAPAIDAAVERLVQHFGISGFAGFDFIYDEASDEAWLLEVNPRVTSACYTAPKGARSLAHVLAEHLAEPQRPYLKPLRAPAAALEQLIALFPQEIERDASSRFLTSADHQVPWHEPDFVRSCIELATRQNIYRKSADVLKGLLGRCAQAQKLGVIDGELGERRVASARH